ncbi:MAG: MBL fold metallo-hydrolase [Oligoflexales bacterium]
MLYLILIFVVSCSSLGENPSKKEQERFTDSAQFSTTTSSFQTTPPQLMKIMNERNFRWELIKKWFSQSDNEKYPGNTIPYASSELSLFEASSTQDAFIWFGHSTLLLHLNQKNILFDPIFSCCASPVPFFVKRFQEPVLSLDQLPNIDFIVISHDHYDHLDMETIQYFIEKDTQFLVPLGVGSHLKSWGVPSDKITELDWWEGKHFDSVHFIATPAQHFSGRTLKSNQTLWASWTLKTTNRSIFFSGDSGYTPLFKKIGDIHGPFDTAFIENGQYSEAWPEVHLLPEESIQVHKDLKSRHLVPIHWSMFALSFHSWFEPAERIFQEAIKEKVSLLIPKIGETVLFDQIKSNNSQETWWRTQKSNKINLFK